MLLLEEMGHWGLEGCCELGGGGGSSNSQEASGHRAEGSGGDSLLLSGLQEISKLFGK